MEEGATIAIIVAGIAAVASLLNVMVTARFAKSRDRTSWLVDHQSQAASDLALAAHRYVAELQPGSVAKALNHEDYEGLDAAYEQALQRQGDFADSCHKHMSVLGPETQHWGLHFYRLSSQLGALAMPRRGVIHHASMSQRNEALGYLNSLSARLLVATRVELKVDPWLLRTRNRLRAARHRRDDAALMKAIEQFVAPVTPEQAPEILVTWRVGNRQLEVPDTALGYRGTDPATGAQLGLRGALALTRIEAWLDRADDLAWVFYISATVLDSRRDTILAEAANLVRFGGQLARQNHYKVPVDFGAPFGERIVSRWVWPMPQA